MQNTKLVQLLRTFNAQEFRQFREYVSSPVFNKNKNVIALLESLKKYYPGFDDSKLTDELMFGEVFKDEEYNYFKIRNISSDLFALGKEYLIFLAQQNDRLYNHKDIFLLGQLRDRNLDQVFEQSYKQYSESLDKFPVKDEYYFYDKLLLIDEMSSYLSPREPNTNLPLLQSSLDNFLKYFLIKVLKYYDVMLHEKKQNNFNFDMKMFEKVMSYIRDNEDENNPTLLMHYNIIMLEKDKDPEYFYALKKLKDEHFDELELKDKYMLFLHMAGYCAYVFNDLGKIDFMKEHFLLSKENFDRGTIKLGRIIYMDFLNHVKIAVRVNEFKWADAYINKYKDHLSEEKEDTLNFCHGIIAYKKGDLDKALDLLSRTNFPHFLIKVQVKILLLQIYYEKGFHEQALGCIDSFRHYLYREKSFKQNFKESFNEFLKLTNELIKLKTSIEGGKDFEWKKLKDDVKNMKSNQFGIKLWLEEQLSV